MDLISLIVILVVVGVILWAVNKYVPMEPRIKNILNVAVIIFVVLWLIVSFLGVTGNSVGNLRID